MAKPAVKAKPESRSEDFLRLSVTPDGAPYDILIGAGLLDKAGSHIAPWLRGKRVIIITDAKLGPIYGKRVAASMKEAGVRCDTLVVPAGEGSKSFAQFESLMNELLALTPDRKTALVALGGGVVGDLTGFAASVLLRGVDFFQIPTTLLAQVDSSVGGKTGINAKTGKNLVGSFHQPRLVLIDTETLATLPEREMRAGYAEVVKYGLIGDAAFFEWLEKNGRKVLARDAKALLHAIHTSCAAKAEIVAQDEFESAGLRALLNLGHTFGHALEAETGYSDTLLHGEAVAIGMVMACRLSEQLGLGPKEMEARVAKHVKECGLPTTPKDIRAKWNIDALCAHFYADKKAEGGTLTFVLLSEIGEAALVREVAAQAARHVVESFAG